jgi:hypothetical protein
VGRTWRGVRRFAPSEVVKTRLLLLGLFVLALSACGSSGHSSEPVIPKVMTARQWELERAYAFLHSKGLRVAVRWDFPSGPMYESDMAGPDIVERVRPLPGTQVKPGSVVTVTAMGTGLGSPVGIPPYHRYRIPDFVGRPATTALRWLNQRPWLHYVMLVPPLPPSNAPSYYAAFRVAAQQPTAGGVLQTGLRGPYAVHRLWLRVTPRR